MLRYNSYKIKNNILSLYLAILRCVFLEVFLGSLINPIYVASNLTGPWYQCVQGNQSMFFPSKYLIYTRLVIVLPSKYLIYRRLVIF